MGLGTKLCVFLAFFAPQRQCVGFKLPFRKDEAAKSALSSPKQEQRSKVLLTSAKIALFATAAVGSVIGVSAAAAGLHVMARVTLHGAQLVCVGLPFLLRNVEGVKEAAQEPASTSALKS